MASTAKQMKKKVKNSNYKNRWLLECNNVTRSDAETHMNIRWCLEHGADANVVNSLGSTPLHAATRRAEPHLVHTLITFKADVNTTDRNGETPLHLAVRYGDGTAHILEHFTLDKRRDEDTPEVQTSHKREVHIVDMLLDVNADTNKTDHFGDTPLHVAVRSGAESVINQLLQHAADVNIRNSAGDTPLHLAAHRGEPPIVDALLIRSAAGINTPNNTDNTPLHLAAHRGVASIVDMLLKLGAKVNMTNSDGDTPLNLATRSGKTEIANMLLKHGAEVNMKNNASFSPLHVAAEGGKEAIVDLLLRSNAELNASNNAGNTALHLAVLQGQAATVVMLLKHGIDVNITNTAGDTSLYLAVLHGEPATVKLLLHRGAHMNTTSSVGNAPLHVAAYLGKARIVDMLLNFKADVNRKDRGGNTPLHLAARRGHAPVVHLLLRHDADVRIRNLDCNTPLTVARVFQFEGNEAVVSLLQKSLDSLVLPKDDRSQLPCSVSEKNDQVAVIDNNLQLDTTFNYLKTDTPFKFEKKTDSSGLSGQLYETKLLSLVLIRALNDEQIEDFLLGTNNSAAGDMDDICLRYQEKGQDRPVVLFVQAKHKDHEKARLTVEDVQNASGEFSLRKYFASYLTIKDQFRADSDDPMFKGDFGDVECNLVIYTPAKDCFTKKNTEYQVSEKVHHLINTGNENLLTTRYKTEVFKFDYDDDDIENLAKMIVIERFIKLGAVFLEMIMSAKSEMILMNNLIARYHVVMGREVLQPSKIQEANKEYRIWEFRPQFFESNSEYWIALKRIFVNELSTKRCDQSKIKPDDVINCQLVLDKPSAANISKIIGKLATYNDKTKKLQLIEVKDFRKKYKSDDFKVLLQKFNEIEINENVIRKAIYIKLKDMKDIKLPLSFGNLDMTFRGSEIKVQKRMKTVAEKLIALFKKNDETMIIDINKDVVGPGKDIEQGIIEINGGIGSAVGNILVLDPVTKMLKFDTDSKTLPHNAALFLGELEDSINNPANKIKQKKINNYRIKINVDGFPKDSLNGDEYGEMLARDFLSKLWFYTNQAKQDEVEQMVKNDIDKYYNNEKNTYQINFKMHSNAIFQSAHGMVQKWWNQKTEANYLNRNNDFFQKSKLDLFTNLLLTVMNHIYKSKMYSVDFKFNPLANQSNACLQAPVAFDLIFGQQFEIFEKQSKRINTEGSQQIKNLVMYAEELAKYFVNACSDPSIIDNVLNHTERKGDIIINYLKNNVEYECEVNKYVKRTGTSEMSGQLYKTKLLCLVLIRALNDEQINDFLLGSNIRDIDDMDDICMRYQVKDQERPLALFLKAKHKEKGNLTVEDVRNPKGDFSLRKYFESYLKIRDRFRADNEDPMFQGDFGDVDCNFVIYTPAKDSFNKKKTEQEVNIKVHDLIKKDDISKGFQFEHEKSDTDFLTKVIVHKRILAILIEFILIEKEMVEVMLANKLIAQYHVVLGREVLQPCKTQQADSECRMWEFNPEFFKNESLKSFIVNELSSNCWDQTEITDEDRNNFDLLLQDPCPSTISKLIGKLVIYNKKHKKLKLVANFKSELMSNDKFKMLAEQFNEIETNEDDITKSIQERLEAKQPFKLPLSFGNLDMILCGSETTSVKKTVSILADNLTKLLELNKETKVVDILDVVGPGKNAEQGIIDIYSCIESAIGNLLVLDPDTKMLKFDLDNEALPDNAALLLKELKENRCKHTNEELNSYRIKVSFNEFPKLSFYGDLCDEKQATNFLSKLWFYPNQAKEDEIELILKDEINRYYIKIGQNGSLQEFIYTNSYDDIQKWWMQTFQSPYLTQASELFERAKESEIGNLLETVINFMFISKTSSVDIKFKQPVSKYFKFVKMHQIFNKMSGILFSIFDNKFNDSINIELPDIKEPLPYSNYTSLGELVFSLEIHHRMEWVAMKMWALSTYTQYFLLAKAGPANESRKAREGFLLQQLYNGRNGHIIEGETDPDDSYSSTIKFN